MVIATRVLPFWVWLEAENLEPKNPRQNRKDQEIVFGKPSPAAENGKYLTPFPRECDFPLYPTLHSAGDGAPIFSSPARLS
jgi:hypothetical protein